MQATAPAGPAAPLAQRGVLPMTPTQALTRGFDLDPAVADVQDEPARLRPDAASRDAAEQRRQGFRVGGLRLMIRYEDGSELTEMPEVYRLPNVPGWFCGMANLHGMLTPVFDLANYLGIEPDPQAKRMLLVLSRGADAAGVVIDGLPERLRWSDADRADARTAPLRLAPHLNGACLIGERLWFDVECDALLDALEQSMRSQQ